MLVRLVRFFTLIALFDSMGILSRMKLYQSCTELTTASSTSFLMLYSTWEWEITNWPRSSDRLFMRLASRNQQAVSLTTLFSPGSCISSKRTPEYGGTSEYVPAGPNTQGLRPRSVWRWANFRGQGILLVFGQEKGTYAWATCRDQADVFGQEIAPVLADELNAVVDEDQGDFAELCLLFRV